METNVAELTRMRKSLGVLLHECSSIWLLWCTKSNQKCIHWKVLPNTKTWVNFTGMDYILLAVKW